MRYAKLIITFFLPVAALMTMASCAHEVAVSPASAAGPTEEPDRNIVKGPTMSEPVLGANPEMSGTVATAEVPAVDAAETEKLGDAKILRVAHEANSAEIAQAEIAEKRARDPRVRDYAKMMIRMHKDADRRGDRVAAAQKIQPAPSATSTKLHADAQTTLTNISVQQGAALDNAYVNAQVEEHSAVLKIIDERLLPGATDARVKALVQEIRPVVASHLEQALTLQSALKEK